MNDNEAHRKLYKCYSLSFIPHDDEDVPGILQTFSGSHPSASVHVTIKARIILQHK